MEVVESVPLERRALTDYVNRLPGATASSYNATNGVNIMGLEQQRDRDDR